MSDTYDEFSDLLGAYALDAVDPDERERIELHLTDCPRCRAEVAEHREVAAYLSHTGATAPEGVWDRIASELSPAAPPMRMTIMPTGEAVSEPDSDAEAASADVVTPIGASRRRPSRPMLAVLAVAASIIVLLGVVAVSQSQRLNQGQSVEEMASDAAADSKLKVDLTGDDGTAKAVVGADGQGYLIMDEAAPPSDGEVYQLWGKVDGTVLSLGTFGDTTVVPFSVDPSRIADIELFAVTEEKAPGVAISEQVPIMAGTV
ncbi:anti-sigma factor domain-containing protein [Aquihabitans daechungensis]|uniref:anti-sigma factor n=1 Tax=Aquihabitans daechungensis TaxID=1052257 RepID=UPI003BA14183